MKPFFTALFALTLLVANAQKHPDYWQQRIYYTMDVSMNVEDFTYK